MSDLVFIKKDTPLTTSKIIAERTENIHRSVQRLMTKYENDFLQFGRVRFEITPSKRNQPEKIYHLNEQQATLLITYLRNTDVVRNFKVELAKEYKNEK